MHAPVLCSLRVALGLWAFAVLTFSHALGQSLEIPDLGIPEADRVGPVDTTVAPGFGAVAYCSHTELRMARIDLNWLSAGAGAAVRVDVAANKYGFEQGQFMKAKIIGPNAEIKLEPSSKLAPGPGPFTFRVDKFEAPKALDIKNPTMKRFKSTLDGAGPNNTLEINGIPFDLNDLLVPSARFVGLEPGVTYFARIVRVTGSGLPAPSTTIEVDAPICTADFVGEEE